MTMRKRYVFDTNTLVSAALFTQSVPQQAFAHALLTGQLLMSALTANELTTVLLRSKFDRYLARARREQFLSSLLPQSCLVAAPGTIIACRDPKDDMFLDLAVHGDAAAIITGDADLLVLHPFRAISILTPHQFVQRNP
ncbi:MAG: putative toxin-antitoxin system toxin component, PIN family [Chloroflexales bacterium]